MTLMMYAGLTLACPGISTPATVWYPAPRCPRCVVCSLRRHRCTTVVTAMHCCFGRVRWGIRVRSPPKMACNSLPVQGDVWAESRFLGTYVECFMCLGGEVYNVSQWAQCQGITRYLHPGEHNIVVRLEQPRDASASQHRRRRSPPRQSSHRGGGRGPSAEDAFLDELLRHMMEERLGGGGRGSGMPPSYQGGSSSSKRKGGRAGRKKR